MCRVCQNSTGVMLNIFDGAGNQDAGISVADMISQCTGFPVAKDDPYPDTICLTCLMDTQNAFKMKETYKRSRQAFASENGLNNDINMDLLDARRDSYEVLDWSDTDPLDAQDPGPSNCLVKNEPIIDGVDTFQVENINNNEPLKCPYCSKTCKDESQLKVHIATHDTEPPKKKCCEEMNEKLNDLQSESAIGFFLFHIMIDDCFSV